MTKLPPTAALRSCPTDWRFSRSSATLSRSIWISDCGWSILVSITGGNANMPLCAAFCCSCCANSRISLCSAVEARMSSTGKLPPPGREGGTTANVCTPGIAATFADNSGSTWKTLRLRSVQGFRPSP